MLPPGGCTVVRGDKCSIKYVDATDHSIKCQGNILGWKENTLVSYHLLTYILVNKMWKYAYRYVYIMQNKIQQYICLVVK